MAKRGEAVEERAIDVLSALATGWKEFCDRSRRRRQLETAMERMGQGEDFLFRAAGRRPPDESRADTHGVFGSKCTSIPHLNPALLSMNIRTRLNLPLFIFLLGCPMFRFAAAQSSSEQQSAGSRSSAQPATPNPRAIPPRQTPFPVPFVSAKTNMVSSKTVVEPGSLNIGGLTLSQTQSQREMSVKVSVQFFSPLSGPFEVQCFFMAKNDTTRSHYIFNFVEEESKTPTFEGEVQSGMILSTTRDWIGIPFAQPGSIPQDGGKLVDASGKTVGADTKSGSKIEGWVIRVVYEGRVLKVDSNQSHLAELANRLPELFDKAAKGK
jgi:hypothetical protein